MVQEIKVQSQIMSYQILKKKKKVLDASVNTQHYKVGIKSKVEQSKERSSVFPPQLNVVPNEKRAVRLPTLLTLTKIAEHIFPQNLTVKLDIIFQIVCLLKKIK